MNKDNLKLEQLQFLSRFISNKQLYDEWFQYPKMQIIEYLFGVDYLTEEFFNQIEKISIGKTTPNLALPKILKSYSFETANVDQEEWIAQLQNSLRDISTILEKIYNRLNRLESDNPCKSIPYFPYPQTPNQPLKYWEMKPTVNSETTTCIYINKETGCCSMLETTSGCTCLKNGITNALKNNFLK